MSCEQSVGDLVKNIQESDRKIVYIDVKDMPAKELHEKTEQIRKSFAQSRSSGNGS